MERGLLERAKEETVGNVKEALNLDVIPHEFFQFKSSWLTFSFSFSSL